MYSPIVTITRVRLPATSPDKIGHFAASSSWSWAGRRAPGWWCGHVPGVPPWFAAASCFTGANVPVVRF